MIPSDMDQSDPQLEGRLPERTSRFLLIFLSLATVFAASGAVVISWHKFSMLLRVNAIVFLALLVVSPFSQIFYYRRGRNPLGPYGGLILGLMLTVLALTLVSR
jgi:hypothetical protein